MPESRGDVKKRFGHRYGGISIPVTSTVRHSCVLNQCVLRTAGISNFVKRGAAYLLKRHQSGRTYTSPGPLSVSLQLFLPLSHKPPVELTSAARETSAYSKLTPPREQDTTCGGFCFSVWLVSRVVGRLPGSEVFKFSAPSPDFRLTYVLNCCYSTTSELLFFRGGSFLDFLFVF